jgi:photosystem II stability/assembly factor-like uncharacterized protein
LNQINDKNERQTMIFKPVSRLLLAVVLAGAVAVAAAFQHPNDVPAMPSKLAAKTSLLAVVQAGERLVAAGLRGVIVYSDDQGKTWVQAKAPVSSDLVALSFPSPQQGWAVGHGGVVLHTSDGGANWDKQLDGAKASQLAIAHFEARAATDPLAERLLADEKGLLEANGTQPFMGVYFENDQVGYVAGTFNRIFRTSDGGTTWEPLMGETDNPKGLHFNGVAGDGAQVYLIGEQGLVWRLDEATKRFAQIPTPYNGTLFGIVVDGPILLAYGMRGNLYRSEDGGRAWTKVPLDSLAGITAGAVLPNHDIALTTQAGALYLSHDQGKTFAPVTTKKRMSFYGIHAVGKDRIVLSGSDGVQLENPQQ